MLLPEVKKQEFANSQITSYKIGEDNYVIVMINWTTQAVRVSMGSRRDHGTSLTEDK